MANLTLRLVKGSPLTNAEVDGNFSNINNELGVVANLATTEKSNLVAAINEIAAESSTNVTITGGTIDGTVITNSTWNGNAIAIANIAGLTTANVPEVTNLYFTNARARTSISVTGAGSYDNTTGIITITGGVTSVVGATGAVSNSQILAGLLTVDGIGSGLDADLLDGQSGDFYANATNISAGTLASTRLPTSGVAASTYGSNSIVPVYTVDTTGRITSASNVAIAVPASAIVSGTIATARLASGTANSTTYLRGDQTWATITGFSSTDDTTTDATYYPVFVTTAGGSTARTSSTKLYFNPSTGTLNATQFNSLSDVALKENISPISSAIDSISKLVGVQFNWKDTKTKSSGVVAQDLEKAIPSLVSTNHDGMKTVNYDGLIAYLIESIKDLDSRLKKYENN